MWRFVKMMPRTAPAELKPESDSIVRWHDVAGVEEAKAELAEIIEFLRDPARFERLGARVPRGVLLHGPPGTGKTLLAKAVAAESGAAFFSQPASAFVEMFAGPRRVAHPQALRHGAQARARDRLHRRARRRRRRAPELRRLQPRAGSDAQPAARRARRLPPLGRRDHGLDEPPRHARRRAPAARPLRPPGLRLAARPARARADPQRARAQQADRRLGRPHGDRARDGGPDRRRSREHLQRGRHPRDQGRPRRHHADRLRRRARARRRGPQDAPHGVRGREAHDRLPRGRATRCSRTSWAAA